MRSNGIRNRLQGGWSSGCTWLGTKLFAAASYNGAKILLKEPHSDFTVFFGFYLYFFSELSVCEISCVKQESNKTSKISEPFLHPYEEIEQQIQRERKAIRSIGKAEKSCHNGLIYFLKSYFYFQTPLLSYLIFYKLIFIFFSASKPFSFTIWPHCPGETGTRGTHSANFDKKVHKPQSKSNMQLIFTHILWIWISASQLFRVWGTPKDPYWCIKPI